LANDRDHPEDSLISRALIDQAEAQGLGDGRSLVGDAQLRVDVLGDRPAERFGTVDVEKRLGATFSTTARPCSSKPISSCL
jgi:hypothetical protein